MKNKIFLIVLIAFSGLLLTSCAKELTPEEEVAQIYWEYWNACQEGKLQLVEPMLSDGAIDEARYVGVCGFTHDNINNIPQYSGGVEHTFSTDPQIVIIDDRAGLTWLDDQGTMTTVMLKKFDGVWKIHETVWSL